MSTIASFDAVRTMGDDADHRDRRSGASGGEPTSRHHLPPDDGARAAVLSVFGLGYVGCVSAACFAARGHRVIGVDVNPSKTQFLREGRAPVIEERIGELTAGVVESGMLDVDDNARRAVLSSDITIVCVGTPSGSGGGLSTVHLCSASEEIGAALREKDDFHVVVFRSTMVPGTCEDLLIPILERESGKRAGIDFGVCVNPEFLREGSSVRDFMTPPKTVVGETDERSGAMVMDLYEGLSGKRFRVPLRVAEMTKYVDNSFHALKVAFGNEIGTICAELGLDSHAVMEIFFADTKLNISDAYLRPGFAFGGSCLPKDVRALMHTARQRDIELPVIGNIMSSNETQIRRVIDMIIATGKRRVGLYGLSFKSGTDDLRESPLVELVERLLGKGFDVRIHDENVTLSSIVGANRDYITEHLPHVGELLTASVDEVMEHGDVIVVASAEPEVVEAIDNASADTLVIDLVRLPGAETRRHAENYSGIGW
ncbi:nucleotide sugar dehydrogenase [Williamsia deligens]|uniref:UDP-glucose 6-dehydrogenase n=1 Tax=Williamsia deligens TaxID=321325 RepID=A0ABW3G2X5_9NOCA|nr:nucleotide sugar dehydrogenase [Williamsia deligens]MCP2194182.1 GDP-mannose 6-dehydrogenase [Williamsia deligens]